MGLRRPVSPHLSESYAAQRKGEEAEHLRRQLLSLPLRERDEVSMTFAATSATSVRHNLKRSPKGYLVVKLGANLSLYKRAADTWDANTFTLYNGSANAGSATVWVF